MAAQPELLGELRRLRARVPQVTAVYAAGTDGLVLAQDAAGVDTEGAAAYTSAAIGAAAGLTGTTERGEFRELLVRGEEGYVAVYTAGPAAVLTVLAGPRTNVGRLHLEARRSGARIAELVDGALDRLENA
nr:roadblock/LC7 domain-containing protein [Streptomyces sp. GC420]